MEVDGELEEMSDRLGFMVVGRKTNGADAEPEIPPAQEQEQDDSPPLFVDLVSQVESGIGSDR
jgi:hypothetical protein